jgi:hypothetical protein
MQVFAFAAYLGPTSVGRGQSNVPVDSDKYVRSDDGPATILMPQGLPIDGRVAHDNPNGTVFGLSGFDGVGASVVVSGHSPTQALCWRHSGEELTTTVQNAGSRLAHARGLGHVAPGLG